LFDEVRSTTRADAVVAFFKARALTLYTDRRSIQSKDLAVIIDRADYFAMSRMDIGGQPFITDEAEGNRVGLVVAWQNDDWVLWRVERTGR
jgi:hypothetical protein